QMGYDERIRLLYVACTRAMDHLVVSLHREERKNPPALKRNRTNAEVLLHGMGDGVEGLPDLSGHAAPLASDPAGPTPPPPAPPPRPRPPLPLRRPRPPAAPPPPGGGPRPPRRSGPRGPRLGGWRGRPRPREAPPRPRPAPVAQGPLRHGHRPRRARRAPDDRP